MDGSAGESQDRSSRINCFPASQCNREPLAMANSGDHEHLISSMSLATCWMTKLACFVAARACLPSESTDVGKF